MGFFRGQPNVLEQLLEFVRSRWPRVRIAYSCSPPFRPHSESEVEQQIQQINSSGVQILFVGLGCPK